MMVEVFKTDVQCPQYARMLVDEIHNTFAGYKANFDLEDCDNILRVKALTGIVQPVLIITLLKRFGWHAEVLPDDILPSGSRIFAAAS